MNLSLKQLKVFLGVANASSFTKTAQSLHLSQAALSAIIRELETQLDCRLFERTTRTVALTETGHLFYPTAMKIVDTLEKSVVELNELGRQKQASLLPYVAHCGSWLMACRNEQEDGAYRPARRANCRMDGRWR